MTRRGQDRRGQDRASRRPDRQATEAGNGQPDRHAIAAREADAMTEQQSYLYLGLAGETGPGRPVDSGLFRLADGSNEWERIERGLPEKPAVRALAVHPFNPALLYAGTQSGLYRSMYCGEDWMKVELP